MLSSALACPERFRRRYLEGEIIPPGVAMGIGTSVHKVNETNLSQKIHTKQDMPLSDMKDAARDSFYGAFENGVYLTRENVPAKDRILNEALNSAINLTTEYHKSIAPEITTPKQIEQKITVDIGLDLPLTGRLDFVNEDGSIFDLKTTSKSWGKNNALTKHWLQSTFYSLLRWKETGTEPPGFIFYVLVNLKTGCKTQTELLKIAQPMYRRLEALFGAFMAMLSSGTFLPAEPGSWMCSEKWCGYFLTCKYMGN
jgi:hypothetical protein